MRWLFRVPSPPQRRRGLAVAVVLALTLLQGPGSPRVFVQAPGAFAARIAQLSEAAGYFDTDNLISNETSYLQVMPALQEAGLSGGAYVGVGPDQNFSYIAQVRPAIAFIIDVRRDNLLLHLLFKALFALADTRVEYLSLLFAVDPPARAGEWRAASIDALAAHVDSARSSRAPGARSQERIDWVIKSFGVPLSDDDLTTIHRFHRTFIDRGLALKFETLGRPPQPSYPGYRDLLLQTDPRGRQRNFLASEDDFGFVRSLQVRDLVIPVVGDLSGPKAVAAIGQLLADRGDRVSALYASNVESYLFTGDRFGSFVNNVSRLPRSSRSVIIRSVFGGFGGFDRSSISLVQRIDELVEGYKTGRIRSYGDLIP